MVNPYGPGFEDMAPPPAAVAAMQAEQRPSKPENAPRAMKIERANPRRWEKSVALEFPLVAEGLGEISCIICRRITGGQLTDLIMRMPEGFSERALREEAYALIAGVPADVLGELEATDFDRVMDAIRPFLPAALRDDLDIAALDLAAGAATGAD